MNKRQLKKKLGPDKWKEYLRAHDKRKIGKPLLQDALDFVLRINSPRFGIAHAPYMREILESFNSDRYQKEFNPAIFSQRPLQQMREAAEFALKVEVEIAQLKAEGKIEYIFMDEIGVSAEHGREVAERLAEAFGYPEIEKRVTNHIENECLKLLEYKPVGVFNPLLSLQPLPVNNLPLFPMEGV